MQWETLLNNAARQFNGGDRSFPPATNVPLYDPPNEEYERLFFNQARSSQATDRCSAGWIVPDERSILSPVFVANSLLSAIWLVHATLPKNTLSDDTWACLAFAANKLSQGTKSQPRAGPISRESESPSPSVASLAGTKRAGSPQFLAPAQRLCTVEDEDEDSSPAGSPPLSPVSEIADPTQPERVITTVTNHNRRADRARNKKLEDQRHTRLGLVQPAHSAPLKERDAFANIAKEDEVKIAWIIKQQVSRDCDFYQGTKMPYYTAKVLLSKAYALASLTAQSCARQFLLTWRERGTLFNIRSPLDSQLSVLPSQNTEDADFCSAWYRCKRYESVLAAMHIEYRWAETLLGRAYVNRIAQIKQNDLVSSNNTTRNRYGKGQVRTEAINALLKLVNPKPTQRERDAFRKRLTRATRWYEIAQGLGWGMLALMPYEHFPNTWVGNECRASDVMLWIELVKRERTEVCAAVKQFDSWLGPEGISGGPISSKTMLYLEGHTPTDTVIEIEDSEDDSSAEATQLSQSQATPTATAPTKNTRQMTLLELFKPLQ